MKLKEEKGPARFAEFSSTALDFALFPDAMKPVDVCTACLSSKSDAFLWIQTQIAKLLSVAYLGNSNRLEGMADCIRCAQRGIARFYRPFFLLFERVGVCVRPFSI